MKKKALGLLACGLPLIMNAQAAFDVLQSSQTELRGTSRFTAMAGAYGALGGDLSTLTQNPGGIGVYRSSDLSLTLNLDFNQSKTATNTDNATKFNCNNFGYVGSMKLNSDVMPYINWGFSYNRLNSFNRRYRGNISNLNTSLSNYIAGATNNMNYTANDLTFKYDQDNKCTFDPYYDSYAPWLGILAYDSYIINGRSDGSLQGLYGNGTTGTGEYEVVQSGHTDEYSLNLGGNIKNKVFWGFGFGITDLSYSSYQYYGETLNNAYVYDSPNNGNMVKGMADYGFENYLSTSGTGYNFKLGVIVKPVNELRIGLAFHTPTFYSLKDTYKTYSSFMMSGTNAAGKQFSYKGSKESGDAGYADESHYTISTPWRFIGSVAGVLGQSAIVSFDYEYVANSTMRIGDEGRNYDQATTNNIKSYYQPTHILRIGGEYRLTPNFSVRAGYSTQNSPVKSVVANNQMEITTTSNNASYQFDKTTQYITCGMGYRYKSFYLDVAYVHKNYKSEYHITPPTLGTDAAPSIYSEVKNNSDRVSATIGFRF